MKRFYKIYFDTNTGRKVIFDNDENLRVASLFLSGSLYYTIQHDLDTMDLIVKIYDENMENEIMVDSIKIIDINTIAITTTTPLPINILLLA